jgi:hypothetical protein
LTAESVPAPHDTHTLAPTAAYLPEPHSVHNAVPVVSLYFPALHCGHALAPVTEDTVPTPQSVHVVTPVVILYFPTAHGVHVPPLDPAYPGLQLQAVTAVLPPGEFEFEKGQAIHDVPPVEYVPAPQSTHDVNKLDPAGLLNPGEQS